MANLFIIRLANSLIKLSGVLNSVGNLLSRRLQKEGRYNNSIQKLNLEN